MDDIRFSCPHCETLLSIDAANAGFSVPCPVCFQKISVPSPNEDSPALETRDSEQRHKERLSELKQLRIE